MPRGDNDDNDSLAGGLAGLDRSIRLSPAAAVISDPRQHDNPIIAANAAFCDLTGYSEFETIARNCRFLTGPGTDPQVTVQIRIAVAQRRAVLVEILNYKRDGTPFRNALMVAPVFDIDGELTYFIGSQVELRGDEAAPCSNRQQQATAQVKLLTPRQRQVLQQIAAGHRSKQIAANLELSEKTIKMHRALLLAKLHTSNMADVVRIAVEAGM